MADETLKYFIQTMYDGAGFKALNNSISDAKDSIASVGKVANDFIGIFTAGAAIGGVASFFKSAISAAYEQETALRQLQSTLVANGISWNANATPIDKWTTSMRAAHMESTDATKALTTAIARTGDLAQAERAVQIAQDVSVATGKDFDSVLDALTRTMGGSSRGLTQLKMMFGEMVASAPDAATAIERLGSAYEGAAAKAKMARSDFKIAWQELLENIGNGASTITNTLTSLFSGIIQWLDRLVTRLQSVGAMMLAVVTSNFSAIKQITAQADADIDKQSSKDNTAGRSTAKIKVSTGFDNSELKTDLSQRLQLIKANLQTELATTAKTYDDKIAVERKATAEEISDITAAEKKGVLTAGEAKVQRAQLAADLATTVKRLEDEKAEKAKQARDKEVAAAKKAQKEQEQVVKQLAKFDADMNSERGQNYKDFFDKQTVEAARAVVVQTKSAEAGLKDLENRYNKASKTISGGWTQALIEMRNAGTNWKNFFAGIWNSVANGFGNAVAKMVVEGGKFGDLMKSLFQTVTEEIISQIVAMAVQWVISHTLMKSAAVAAAGVETAASTASGIASVAESKIVAVAQIEAAAAAAAAWAMAAAYMVPGIGALLAEAAGLEASADVMVTAGAMLAFKAGGSIPGAINEAIPILAHGGEYMLNADTTAALGLTGAGPNAQSGLVAALSGGSSQTVNAPITVNVAGGISSELDGKKICQAITTAANKGSKEVLYAANVLAKIGAKQSGKSI